MTSMLADTMRSIHCIAAAAVATTCLAWGGTPALADVTIADSGGALTGLAFDRQSSRLFAVSESDGTNILVTDSKGEKAGTVSFTASTESVQGLALHSDALYVGDIGDPNATRKKVTVYRLPTAVGNQPYQAYDFSYPDGSHDAKALLVSGKGRIYIITGGDQPGIYYAETEPSRSATNKLTRAADAPAGVTDAVFLADGVTMAIRTATGVQVMDARSWEARATVTYEGAPDGESLTAFADDKILVGAGPQLREEAVPVSDGAITISPSGEGASASPEASAPDTAASSPAATEGGSAAPDPEQKTSQPARGGTRLALAAAAVLALVLGAIVFFRKN